MAEGAGTFSESWYRVADQRVALRPHVRVRRQWYRGDRWYVLHDPTNNLFFRLRPSAYEFIAHLRRERTIEEVWQECLALYPDDAPGQEEILRLLAQLYAANLLHAELPPDSAKLFERYERRRQREIGSRLLNIMFARVPLFDPDPWLRQAAPLLRGVFSRWGALVWVIVVGAALKIVVDRFDLVREQGQAVLAPANLVLLYAGFILTKAVHEMGHACACRRFGGEVHAVGILFMIFTPVPYVDATSSWGFRSRGQRVLVGAAGMITELFLAALATFVWAGTGEGTLHSLAYNMMFVASVSTLLFNLNPLMRFDGYYILCDVLDLPNLQLRAIRQLTHLLERYGFGRRKSESPALRRSEALWLTGFGLASYAYRIVVFAGILLVLADRFLLLGILMAVVCAFTWLVLPLGKFVHYLALSPRLERHRLRAVSVTLAVVAALVALLGFVPFPHAFRAPGVLQAEEWTVVVTEAPGYVREVLSPPGSDVAAGQPLVRMEDQEVGLLLEAARAELAQVQALELRALQQQAADVQPLRRRRDAVRQRLDRLRAQEESLTVRARHAGRWVAPDLTNYVRAWIPRGAQLGQVINARSFYFSAVVSQREASRLFNREIRWASVRLHGEGNAPVPVVSQVLIPAEHLVLPSAALGWLGGGEVPVAANDPAGTRVIEPFFELRAVLPADAPAALLHGRSGVIRFTLDAQPLLQQWVRMLRQLLQTRYSL